MSTPAIEIKNAVKYQGNRQTLHQLSLDVAPGERVALLGHNGAGKTTLIRMVLGLTRIDGGSIKIYGAAPGEAQARRLCAYLPESVAFQKALTGTEQLRLFARLLGVSTKSVAPLLERVGLGEAADRRIGTWSKGMRQRLGLAQVLIGKPKVALLDEPTSGLDPISRREFYAILDELAHSGTAVLVSSHALTELEARTDRIAILRNGHLVANSSLGALRKDAQLPIRLRIAAMNDKADAIAKKFGGMRINGRGVEFTCTQSEKMQQLAAITSLGGMIEDIEIIPPSLEDLYRHHATKGDVS